MSYRLFLLIVLLMSFSTFKAQSHPQQEDIQKLAQKVDSLEHELSYLKLTYELSTLNSDITMFSNEVYSKSIAIQLDLYNRNFDRRLCDAYQRYYESCLRRQESFAGLIEAKKTYFVLKVISYPYTEPEFNMLSASYNAIDDAYSTLQSSMEMLKVTFEAYRKLM